MAQEIASIGFEIPGGDASYVPFRSRASLLDYDITVFDPCIRSYYRFCFDDYQGKPALDDQSSFQLREQLDHWRQELLAAIKAGRTVFVLLNSLETVYAATGERSYSGTGRSQKTTRHVALCRNYDFVPGRLNIRSSNGTSMRLEGKDNVLAAYWSDLGAESEYRVLVESDHGQKLVFARTGDNSVGVLYQFKPGFPR